MGRRMGRWLAAGLLLALLLLPRPGAAQIQMLEGSVGWPGGTALPRSAEIVVHIDDIGGGRAGSASIASMRLKPEIQPTSFRIAYDRAVAPAGRRYRLRAEIRVRGKVLFAGGRDVSLGPEDPAFIPISLESPSATRSTASPLARAWRAVEIRGDAVPPGVAVTLVLDDGRFGTGAAGEGELKGSTGCNRISADFRLGAETLEIGRIQKTFRGCSPRRLGIERRYLGGLRRVAAWKVTGPQLVLSDAAGLTLLIFRDDL